MTDADLRRIYQDAHDRGPSEYTQAQRHIFGLRAVATAAATEVCTWTEDEEGTWEADCGKLWSLIDGTPTENGIKFCHGCGKPMKEVPYEQDDE